jgi:UDP-N-acetylmuramoyl-L-alanyl-D-glutamate--2,6-diaminopimelate ligase
MVSLNDVLDNLLAGEGLLETHGAFGLCENSATVMEKDIFIAAAEDKDQRQSHVEQALSAGAAAILFDQAHRLDGDFAVPKVGVKNLSGRKSELASRFYAAPSKKIECVGITGTNGKTSIGFHIADLSDLLGASCGYCGTLGWGRISELSAGALTTPNAVEMQRRLAALREDNISRVALEISSHALAQDRVDDVHLDIGVFANLTRDHLDFHKTMDAYGKAKARLFTDWPLKLAVINSDDEFGRNLMATARAQEVISYGKSADISWQASPMNKGMQVKFETPWGKLDCRLPVVADFAVANLSACVAVMMGLGHKFSDLADAIESMRPVPGRMQVLERVQGRPQVVVDYAHTPDAVGRALSSIRAQSRGLVVCVVGCGGDRDRGKRPKIAIKACGSSDAVWLTSDNPRNEPPDQIIEDMLAGVKNTSSCSIQVEVDRAKSIAAAIDFAGPNDVVLIVGKGHEMTQEIGGRWIRFSDVEHAEKLLRRDG